MNVYVDSSKLIDRLDSYLPGASGSAVRNAITRSCALVETQAKKNLAETTNGTGQLMQSITSVINDTYGEVGTNLTYAIYVHQGTGLYAENGDGRTWDLPWHYQDASGEWHASSGQHPNPFLERALDDNRKAINEEFKKAFKEGSK